MPDAIAVTIKGDVSHLSEAQKQRIAQRAVAMRNAQESLLGFATYNFPAYIRAPHLEMVARELERIERGENNRLIVELPPRHGKSWLISQIFPAWYLCRNPTKTVIAASYGDKLAHEMGRRARNLVMEQKCFRQEEVGLLPDSKAKDFWHTVQDGQFLAVGIGSGVIGFGGELITIDDPYGKAEDPEGGISETQRRNIWNWYSTEIIHRQTKTTAIVIVAHRWHEDDLSGKLLQIEGNAKEGGKWTVISLPAVAEEDDMLGREVGAALWPEMFDLEFFDSIRPIMGEHIWNALFQQRPRPQEGAIFRWFPRYERLPPMRKIVIGIDTAYTDTKGSDYTAWAAWGTDGARLYLIEAGRIKGLTHEAQKHILRFYYKMRQQHQCETIGLVRRAVAIDRIAAQQLRVGATTIGQDGELGRMGMPVTDVKLPRGATAEIAEMMSVEFEGGRCLVPEDGPRWLAEWIREHQECPHGKNDDWVETTNLAVHYIFRARAFVRPPPRKLWAAGV